MVLKRTGGGHDVYFNPTEAGANLGDVMAWFAGLDRSQVEPVIEFAARSLDMPPGYGQ